MPQDATDLERYFRDPKVGDAVLASGSSGLACKNIRLALRFLDLHDSIDFSETYDAALAGDVLRFQQAYNHTSRDGQVGPGTRRLLTRVLLEKMGEGVFKRMGDPERRDIGQVFVSYARADSGPVRSMVERIRKATERAKRAASVAKAVSSAAMSDTSHSIRKSLSRLAASGRTRFSRASPW